MPTDFARLPPTTGRVYATTRDQAAKTSGTITGNLYIDDRTVFVLFDTGATHSIISTTFAKKLNMNPTPLIERVIISTPMKNHMLIDHEYVNCPLRFADRLLRLDRLNLASMSIIPVAEPISKAPFLMAPLMKKLKTVQEMLENAFVRESIDISKTVFVSLMATTNSWLSHRSSNAPAVSIFWNPSKVEAITKWPRPTTEIEERKSKKLKGLNGELWAIVQNVEERVNILSSQDVQRFETVHLVEWNETISVEIPMWKWDEISMDFDTKAWGTRLKFSTAFHPQTDGQSERTIQTLEDMLRACALEWTGSWDEYLCLVEFAYNNSWHASIKAAPFELLYGRKCRAPICWDEVGERLIEGPELIEITNEKVAVAKEKLKEARSRQKSYADKHRRDLEFQVGDRVFLKVSPFRGVKRFGIKGKLSPRFIGPFEILERIGEVSYRLALPPQLSHVHDVFHVSLLRGYHYHPLHVASYPFDQIQPDMSLSEEPESILDRQERVMRNKVIPFVKILWKNHPEREATWETEESMRASYPHFFV
ncbi:putative nucleotidyltransferase, ribonuclease H [Tanacetum coccineum]